MKVEFQKVEGVTDELAEGSTANGNELGNLNEQTADAPRSSSSIQGDHTVREREV
jgi:hypothetical protein